jgi:hypothetical protein
VPLQVLIAHAGMPLGPERLSNVAKVTSLVTWSERTPVAVMMSSTDASSDRVNGTDVLRPARIELTPLAPLDARWYAVLVDPLPPGTLTTGVFTPVGTTGIAARFSPVSDPRLARVGRCFGDGRGDKMTVEFSEPISAFGPGDLVVTAGSVCDFYLPAGAGSATGRFSTACPNIDRSAAVQVTLGPLTAVTGLPVKGAGTTRTFPAASFGPPLPASRANGGCDGVTVDD